MIKKLRKIKPTPTESKTVSFNYGEIPNDFMVEETADVVEGEVQESTDFKDDDFESADTKPAIKLVSYNDGHSPDNTDDEEEQFVETETEQSEPENQSFSLETLETSIDGIKYVPLNVSVYSDVDISDREMKIAKAIGKPSLVKTLRGTLVPCTVVKTSNSFCILKKIENSYKLVWMMRRIDIQKKVKAKDGKVYVDTVIADESREKLIRIPMSDFLESHINSLMKYNISMCSFYSITMSIYFQRLLEKMPMQDASQSLGIVYDTDTSKYVFNAYDIPNGFTYQTEYEDWEEYVDAFNELVEPSAALQYLVATAMSAPVLTLPQKKYNIDVHSYCVNIVGSSSTGKTISSRFCSALWTNPKSDKIFSAMLATSNAALKRLDGRYGIPTILDESTVLGGISPTEYGYSVYEREKRRLNSDCSEKASGTWSTVVIMSSEQHFHDNSKVQNGGMAVRVHSMENLTFTINKDHAEALNDFIRENWGMVGFQFTDWLFRNLLSDIEKNVRKSERNYA